MFWIFFPRKGHTKRNGVGGGASVAEMTRAGQQGGRRVTSAPALACPSPWRTDTDELFFIFPGSIQNERNEVCKHFQQDRN